MSDPDAPEQRPSLPPEGVSLGGLGAGDYDRSLKAGGAGEAGDERAAGGAGEAGTAGQPSTLGGAGEAGTAGRPSTLGGAGEAGTAGRPSTLGGAGESRHVRPEGATGESPPAESVAADEDRLGLPRGGLVAFRKSGGLRFTSRGLVVFRSGWVVPLAGTEGRPRMIAAEALAALEGLLQTSGLSRTRRKARATPDGYGYEITARYGGRTRYAETADGMIPQELGRLIEVLQRLMPEG